MVCGNIYAAKLVFVPSCKEKNELLESNSDQVLNADEIKNLLQDCNLESIKDSMEALTNERSELESIINEYDEKYATLKSDLQIKFSDVDSIVKFLESLIFEMAEKFNVFERKIVAADEKLVSIGSTLIDKIDEIELKFENIHSSISNLAEKIPEIHENFDNFKSLTENQLLNLESTSTDHKKEVEAKFENMESTISNLGEKVSEIQENFNKTKSEIENQIDEKLKVMDDEVLEKLKIFETSISSNIEEKNKTLESNTFNLVNEKLNNLESSINNDVNRKLSIMETTVGLTPSFIEVDKKIKNLESSLNSTNEVKFNEIQEIIMGLRTESAPRIKMEELARSLSETENIFQESSRDIITNQNEINQVKLMLQNETDKNRNLMDEVKLLSERIDNLVLTRVRARLET